MKKKIYLIILVLLVLISIILIIVINNKKNINIEKTNELWSIYDSNLENVKNNMDEITIPNENFFWWELKDFNINDTEYKKVLNKLVSDIRMCYLRFTDEDEIYTIYNPLVNYRDKTEITKEELAILNTMKPCVTNDRFISYGNLLVSENEEVRNNFLNKLSMSEKFYKLDLFRSDELTYEQLVYRTILETSYLSTLSEWLRQEYNNFK